MINLTKRNNFRLEIPDDNVSTFVWQVQTVEVPTVSMETAAINRGGDYKKLANNNIAGSGTSFDDLTITFLLDENLKTYSELLAWMFTMNNPTGASNHDGKVVSTMLLHVLDNNKENIVNTFRFINPFPKNIGTIEWNYTESGDVEAITCDVTFEVAYFEMIIKTGEEDVIVSPY